MVNEIEMMFINKIFEDNLLIFKSKVQLSHLNDPFAKVMYFEISKALREYGELIPSKHLLSLVNDENRMEKFKELKYPLEIKSVSNIINYIKSFNSDKKIITFEKTILDDHTRKLMTEISEEMLEDVCDSKKSIRDIMRKYSYQIDSLKYDNEDRIQFLSAQDIIEEEIKRLNSDEVLSYTKTGFNFIDDIAGGITAPSTVYLVAPSGVGKSIWLYDATVRALRDGKKVMFATVEIPAKEAYMKILSNFTGIKYHTILKKEFTKDERIKYENGLKEFEKYRDNLYIIYDESGMSPQDIKHYYKNLEKCDIKCDYIMIDYLGLLKSDDNKHSENERYAILPKQIRILSQETNSIILIPHQLKTQQSNKDIEDLEPSGIYYAMPLMHESTLSYFMTRKQDDGIDVTLVRNFKSRIGEVKGTYVFENADRNYCMLGEDKLYLNNQYSW